MKKYVTSMVLLIAIMLGACAKKTTPIAEEIIPDAATDQAYNELSESLSNEINQLQIQVSQLAGALTISVAETMFFDSGSAELKTNSMEVLDRIAEILKDMEGKNIRIEGHTDNVKISKKLLDKYPTNWELSADRAVKVARYLSEKAGLDPASLSAVGYGEFRPKADNTTKEGRAANRRIEIVIIDKLQYQKQELLNSQVSNTTATNQAATNN